MLSINKTFLFDVPWTFVIAAKGEGFPSPAKFKCANDFFLNQTLTWIRNWLYYSKISRKEDLVFRSHIPVPAAGGFLNLPLARNEAIK